MRDEAIFMVLLHYEIASGYSPRNDGESSQ